MEASVRTWLTNLSTKETACLSAETARLELQDLQREARLLLADYQSGYVPPDPVPVNFQERVFYAVVMGFGLCFLVGLAAGFWGGVWFHLC